jgi:hypothetical protein
MVCQGWDNMRLFWMVQWNSYHLSVIVGDLTLSINSLTRRC